jgi:hypothetical protein
MARDAFPIFLSLSSSVLSSVLLTLGPNESLFPTRYAGIEASPRQREWTKAAAFVDESSRKIWTKAADSCGRKQPHILAISRLG